MNPYTPPVLPHLQLYHGFETHALFVDLVKAFKTPRPTILSPSQKCDIMIQATEKMYLNCVVQLKFGKDICEITYKARVQSGPSPIPIHYASTGGNPTQ